ncbi:hypothetical protein J6524_23770 [Bradyrhizobium sp. WSM 1738]|uniref:hypothetical protein n=1 Tax=Bradyrhizobium hereditatis TaxID=2821405 RepID=UPI001CE2FF0E|nr:hypothetical protein [Bradyrhizobium hereditatis]MCA6117871.1 hypothetical protein [Bradyrhizobium hereditatis]
MISIWNEMKAWFRDSLTILWARIQYVIGIVGAGLIAVFSDYDFTQLSTMDVQSAFKVLAFAALAGVITEACRRRTL